jgi:spore germination protein GerM
VKRGRAFRYGGRSAVLVAALTLTACGVDAQAEPEVLDAGQAPSGLLEEELTPPVTTGALTTSRVTIYLVDANGLVEIRRRADGPITPSLALETLLDGPDRSETRAGRRTAIPRGTDLRGVTVEGGVAAVDLSNEFATEGVEQITALAQLVYTMTRLPGVDRMRLLLGGNPVEVPRADGTLTSRTVSRTDYPRSG